MRLFPERAQLHDQSSLRRQDSQEEYSGESRVREGADRTLWCQNGPRLGRRWQAVARLGGDQSISCGKVPVAYSRQQKKGTEIFPPPFLTPSTSARRSAGS